MIKLTPSQKISTGAMVVALNTLALYAASVLPTLRIASLALSSAFVYCLSSEKEYLSSIVSFIATSVISFLILPEKLVLAPYIILIGHYGIFKPFIEDKVRDKLTNFIVKIIYCNVFCGIGIAFCLIVLNMDLSLLNISIPYWGIILIAEAVFVAWDIIFSLCAKIYNSNIRNHLMPKR